MKVFGNVFGVTTPFYFGVHILNTNHFANASDDTVTLEAIAGRHLFRVHFGEVKLLVEIVEQGAVLVAVHVEQPLRRVDFG